MERVKDKVAIVTGAATGIGKATALLLAREGACVTVSTDRNITGGEKVVAEITREGGRAVFARQDVTREQDWIDVIKKTRSEFGGFDILVNNAGVMLFQKIEDTSLEEWQHLMNINLNGVFLGTKHAIKSMKDSGGGSIINMSSIAGIVGTLEDSSAYCASKGAIRVFTKAAALECSKEGYDYNIRVNSVHPGAIDETSLMNPYLNDEVVMQKLKANPRVWTGTPVDVAYAVLYLASDESRFVTGAELVVDGGWTAK